MIENKNKTSIRSNRKSHRSFHVAKKHQLREVDHSNPPLTKLFAGKKKKKKKKMRRVEYEEERRDFKFGEERILVVKVRIGFSFPVAVILTLLDDR